MVFGVEVIRYMEKAFVMASMASGTLAVLMISCPEARDMASERT